MRSWGQASLHCARQSGPKPVPDVHSHALGALRRSPTKRKRISSIPEHRDAIEIGCLKSILTSILSLGHLCTAPAKLASRLRPTFALTPQRTTSLADAKHLHPLHPWAARCHRDGHCGQCGTHIQSALTCISSFGQLCTEPASLDPRLLPNSAFTPSAQYVARRRHARTSTNSISWQYGAMEICSAVSVETVYSPP